MSTSVHRRAAAIAALAARDPSHFAWLDGGETARGFLGVEADLVLEGDDVALLSEADAAWRREPERVWLGWITFDFAADLVLGRAPRARALPGVLLRRYAGALELAPHAGVLGHGDAAAWRPLADALADGAEQDGAWPLAP